MKADMPIKEFWAALKKYLFDFFDMKEYSLCAAEEDAVKKLKDQVYSQWSWNYGASPPHNVRKTRRIEGCGRIEIFLDVEKGGLIKNAAFRGDFFGLDDAEKLEEMLKGHRLEYNDLAAVVKNIEISRYFHNTDAETILSLLLE